MLGATTYPQLIVLTKNNVFELRPILVFTLMPYYLAGRRHSRRHFRTVTDPHGASMADAAVQVTNTGTGATFNFQYINQRWNAALFFVKQSHYADRRARAAGTLLWPMNSLTSQCCRLGPQKTTRPQSASRLYSETHRRSQQAIFLLWVLGIEEPAIGPAQRNQLHCADRRDAGR